MERGGIGLHHFSDQSYAPAGKHTSNNRSTTRSTTVLLLVVLNVVCRVQTVTSHQQETVSKNDSRFNHANKQFFAQTAARRPMVGGVVRLTAARRLISVGGGVRNSAARRHRRGPLALLRHSGTPIGHSSQPSDVNLPVKSFSHKIIR
jgi:hypothetical protein